VNTEYKTPFTYFGGKSRAAPLVWDALGNPANYVEPFFGSGAVLFTRPHPPRLETVNDIDHFIVNFWRAVQHDPEQVALYADNPVFEDDLTARHIWLVKHGIPELDAHIPADPDYFDAKIAGWWVWGMCCWIGGGWCSGNGPWTEEEGKLIYKPGNGVKRQIVHLGTPGQGVNRQMVHLGDAGQGVIRENSDVTSKRVHMGRRIGVNRHRQNLVEYFDSISERLRNVRVCSGDWSKVVTDGALDHGDIVGIFLDPPYDMGIREKRIYNQDKPNIAQEVLDWCIKHGDNPRYRIVLAGYEGEHNRLEELGWRKVAWKARRAYGTSNSETANTENRFKERLWMNKNCVGQAQLW